MARSTRPVFLNLTQIRMPVGALTSIGHRVTGVLLAASVPVGVFFWIAHFRTSKDSPMSRACWRTGLSRRRW